MEKKLFTVGGIVFLLILNLSLCSAYEKEIGQLSSTITDSISKSGKKTIAVVDFTDLEGDATEVGRFISEEISTNLEAGGKSFSVLDRINLKNILSKHKLKISDLADPSTIRKLGKIAGVDAIVTGSVAPFGDNVRVTVKIVATSNAKVIGIAKTDIAKTKAIEDLLSRGGEVAPQTNVLDSTAHNAAPVEAQQKAESHDVVMELMGCKIAERIVSCSLIVKTKRDRTVNICTHGWMGNDTQIVDDSQKKYVATNIQFLDSNSQACLDKRLMPDIPAKGTLTFEGVPLNLKKIALLNINGSYGGSGLFQFRNIPLSREVETSKAQQKIEVNSFIFELKGCNLSDRVVNCPFIVTNNGADRNFELNVGDGHGSALYDDQNISHSAKSIRLLDGSGNWVIEKRLMSDIPVAGSITFEGISPQVKKIALLEISGSSGLFQFRNIPLSREVVEGTDTQNAATQDIAPAKVQNKITENGFVFENVICNRTPSLNEVFCSLTITNQGREGRSLTFRNGAETVIFDESGVSYSSKMSFDGIDLVWNSNRFMPGVHVLAAFIFGNVPQQVNKIALLEMTYDTDNAKSDKLKFHNIPISPPS